MRFWGVVKRQTKGFSSMFSRVDQSYQSNPTGMPVLQSASEKATNWEKNMNKCNLAFSTVRINWRITEGSTDVSTGIQCNIQTGTDEVWVLSLGKQVRVPKGTTKWEMRHLSNKKVILRKPRATISTHAKQLLTLKITHKILSIWYLQFKPFGKDF